MLCKLHYTLPSQHEFGPPVIEPAVWFRFTSKSNTLFQLTLEAVTAKKMKPSKKEENGSFRKQTLDSLSCRSALLLSVVCCIALIHVELRLQEHHRLISTSVTCCDQMESKILQKVHWQQNNEEWQMTKGSHFLGVKDSRQRVGL